MQTGLPIRVGVIGCGGIAMQAHLPALREIAGAEVVAVCDVDPERRRKAATAFEVPRDYSLYRQMLEREQLDGVFILTEPDQLFRITLNCLRAGLHAFMEKPPGITLFQAETLLREARKAGRILQVGFNRRYHPLVRHVVELMRTHTTITQVEGRLNKHGAAAFFDGCASTFECDTIHAIDLVRWIAAGTPVEATLTEGQVNDVVPNSWNAIARFDNGVTGLIRANYQTGCRTHTLEIHGPEASAFVNLGIGDAACDAQVIFSDGEPIQSLASNGCGEKRQMYFNGIDLASSPAFHACHGFLQEDQEFIDCIREGRRPLADIAEGVETMRFIELLRAGTFASSRLQVGYAMNILSKVKDR